MFMVGGDGTGNMVFAVIVLSTYNSDINNVQLKLTQALIGTEMILGT